MSCMGNLLQVRDVDTEGKNMDIILGLEQLAQAKGYRIMYSEKLTLDAVHVLLNFLNDDRALDERYQHHLCKQVISKVTMDSISIASKQIEIPSGGVTELDDFFEAQKFGLKQLSPVAFNEVLKIPDRPNTLDKPKTKASSDIGLTKLLEDNKKVLDLLNRRK